MPRQERRFRNANLHLKIEKIFPSIRQSKWAEMDVYLDIDGAV